MEGWTAGVSPGLLLQTSTLAENLIKVIYFTLNRHIMIFLYEN